MRYRLLVLDGLYDTTLKPLNVADNNIILQSNLEHKKKLNSFLYMNHKCETRNKNQVSLIIRPSSKTLTLKSIIIIEPKIYNLIPHSIRNIQRKSSIKNAQFTYMSTFAIIHLHNDSNKQLTNVVTL